MGKKLYVGNLAWGTTEDALRSAFEADGRQVDEVAIITDRETGRPPLFAVRRTPDQAPPAGSALIGGKA